MDDTRPFVGRQREIELLLDRLATAEAGRGGVVLVGGPAGIGKTRLVEEALSRYAPTSGVPSVGRGLCSSDRGAPPLWPWHRAVRAVRGVTGAADLTPAGLTPAGLTPAARAASDDLGIDPAAVAAAQFAVLTAATDALLDLCEDRPVVLLLEDVHWADAASLELLRRVAAEAGTARLLVVATHRDVLAGDVAAAIAEVRRSAAVTTVTLGPLSELEVSEYLGAINAALAEAPDVYRDTGGVPLLLATTTPGNTGTGDLDLVVTGMMAALSAADRDVIEALAILGPLTDVSLLAIVAGTDPANTAAALAAGRRAGLLGAPRDGAIAFSHALLQDGVRRSADAAVSQARHRRAADVLAPRAVADPRLAGEVAVHWRRAGADPSAAREAARFAELAADQAARAFALDDAVRHLRDAEASLRLAGASDADIASLLLRLATAEFRAGRVAESLARCEAAAAVAARAGRPDLVAASALVVRGVTEAAVNAVVERLCRRALDAEVTPDIRARLLAQLATSAADSSRPVEAAEIAADALRIAESAGDAAALLDALRAREMTLMMPEWAAERVRLGRLAIELAERLGQPLAAVIGAGWLVRGAYELGRMDEVDDAYALMEAVATASAQPLARWHLLRASASRAALEGRFAAARATNLAALALARGLGDLSAIGLSFAHASETAIFRGDPGDLLENSLEIMATAPRMPLMRAAFANVYVVLGRRDEAYALYEELRLEAPSMLVDLRWGPAVLHLGQLAVTFDDAATAEVVFDLLTSWREVRGAVGTPTAYFVGSPLRDLGRLAATAGRVDEAETLLREAIQRNLAVRARPFVALARLDLAGVLQRTGSLGDAATLVRQAADDLRRLEMPGPLLQADRLAASIAAARHHADPLSPRERQIHDLVVRAMSNREIAAQLVLSERTVESHVRSILAKIGCANRTELLARQTKG